jgi:hypothetical protein
VGRENRGHILGDGVNGEIRRGQAQPLDNGLHVPEQRALALRAQPGELEFDDSTIGRQIVVKLACGTHRSPTPMSSPRSESDLRSCGAAVFMLDTARSRPLTVEHVEFSRFRSEGRMSQRVVGRTPAPSRPAGRMQRGGSGGLAVSGCAAVADESGCRIFD